MGTSGAATAPTSRLTLPPESSSPAGARRWIGAQLAGYSEPLVGMATLLLSEMVTNAVLHAGTDIEVVVHQSGKRLRIDVADRSPTLPAAKNYARDAATGRGLVLLEALASGWGVEPVTGGKVVWFELIDGMDTGAMDTGAMQAMGAPDATLDDWPDLEDWPVVETSGAGPPPDEPPVDALVGIKLLGLPLALTRRTSEQYDALFREFRLILERDPGEGHAVPGRLLALGDELTSRFSSFTVGNDAAMRDAYSRGDDAIDLDYTLPATVGPAAGHYDELLDEADAYCRAGTELLTLAPPADAVALRRWVLQEFVGQVAGRAPVAWADSSFAGQL